MAFRLIWSPAARDDLRDVVSFIARDSKSRAETFGLRLMREVERLRDHPELGRVAPELEVPSIRELVVRSYRLIYRVSKESNSVEVVRVWHAARGAPEL